MRVIQAFQVFFRVLFDAAFAGQVARLGEGASAPSPAAGAASPKAPAGTAPQPRRNDAIALLAVLQREGRLVDFLQEPIDAFADAQIGAAAREVHRGCRQALDRLFRLTPAISAAEGSTLRVEKDYDPGRLRLTGQVSGGPPCSGTVIHPGWEATRCELPEWTGSDAALRVVTPAEIEVR